MKKFLDKKIIIVLLIVLLSCGFFYNQNNSIVYTNHSIYSEKIPKSFDGYKILQISDLHNKEFGDDQKKLMSKIKSADPDIVVITGDIVDSRRYDEEPSLRLVTELVALYPTYYVNGNHESRRTEYPEFEEKLISIGVNVLANSGELITVGDSSILISGVNDPCFTECEFTGMPEYYTENHDEYFSILLSHRPELFDTYEYYEVDLTFSGHAHGGQIRLPFIGGVIAPNQGIFPSYTEGIYVKGNSNMVVSRGLGNSLFPLRVFNKPELVVVTLNSISSNM